MCQLPTEYTPVIGSVNPELIKYANKLGKTIPTPDECIATVRGSMELSDDALEMAAGGALTSIVRKDEYEKDKYVLHCLDCENEVIADEFLTVCRHCGSQKLMCLNR